MKTLRTLLALSLPFLVVPPGCGQEPGALSPSEKACLTLAKEGAKADPDIWQAKLREALTACEKPDIAPHIRAEALLESAYVLDLEDEIETYRQVVELVREELPDSALLPRALVKLADAVSRQGDHDQGLELMLESLAERERIFGRESREYLRGQVVVGVTYTTMEADHTPKPHFETGVAYLREAVRSATRLFGPVDPTTLTAKVHLAESLRASGRAEEADQLARDFLGREIDEGW